MAFQCKNCGECCGPVPVTGQELADIRSEIKKMPELERNRLMKQKRPPLTCLFRDMEHNKCAVYRVRPEICRMFGRYAGMECPENKGKATKGRKEGAMRLGASPPVAILSLQISWQNIIN